MGPWLPIYGYGGVLILILLKPFREKTISIIYTYLFIMWNN